MYSKNVLLILLLAAFLSVVSSLRIKNNHFSNLQHHSLEHNLENMLHHRDLDSHDEEIPNKVFDDLKEYVANDTAITTRIHAQKPLSQVSADKVKNYFLENKQFKEFTIKNLVQGTQNPHCLDNLDEKNREKLFQIILDQIDFSTIFLPQKHQQQFTQQQIQSIVYQLKTDKQLGPYLERCFGKKRR